MPGNSEGTGPPPETIQLPATVERAQSSTVGGDPGATTDFGAAGAARPVHAPAQGRGDSIADYDLLSELGRGGMGVVYKAQDRRLGRPVALKVILAGGHAGTVERQRFQVEVEAAARLQHPHIAQVYQVGEHDGQPYMAMEFCPGGTLEAHIKDQPQPPREAAELVATLADALQHAHEAGIIHRDIKPANVLLAADGSPKVVDFGLAKRVDGDDGFTQTGAIMGSLGYMARPSRPLAARAMPRPAPTCTRWAPYSTGCSPADPRFTVSTSWTRSPRSSSAIPSRSGRCSRVCRSIW